MLSVVHSSPTLDGSGAAMLQSEKRSVATTPMRGTPSYCSMPALIHLGGEVAPGMGAGSVVEESVGCSVMRRPACSYCSLALMLKETAAPRNLVSAPEVTESVWDEVGAAGGLWSVEALA